MKLHDIFPTVEIVEYSLYTLLALSFLILLLLYFSYTLLYKHKRKNISSFQILKHYPKDNAKKTAYLFSHYGKDVIKNEEQALLLSKINAKVSDFKFTKGFQDVPPDMKLDIDYFLTIVKSKND